MFQPALTGLADALVGTRAVVATVVIAAKTRIDVRRNMGVSYLVEFDTRMGQGTYVPRSTPIPAFEHCVMTVTTRCCQSLNIDEQSPPSHDRIARCSRFPGFRARQSPAWYVDDNGLWRSLRDDWRNLQRGTALQRDKVRPSHNIATVRTRASGYRPSPTGLRVIRSKEPEAYRRSPMDDLSARLEALLRSLRLFAASTDHSQDAQMGEQFRKDLALLVTEYGHDAVSAALDEDAGWGTAFDLAPLKAAALPMARDSRLPATAPRGRRIVRPAERNPSRSIAVG